MKSFEIMMLGSLLMQKIHPQVLEKFSLFRDSQKHAWVIFDQQVEIKHREMNGWTVVHEEKVLDH